jgi:hypothetical protein
MLEIESVRSGSHSGSVCCGRGFGSVERHTKNEWITGIQHRTARGEVHHNEPLHASKICAITIPDLIVLNFFPARELGLFHVMDHDWLQTLQFKVDFHELDDVPRKNEVQIALPPLPTFSVGRLGSADAQRRCFVGTREQTTSLEQEWRNKLQHKRATINTFLRIEQGNTLYDLPTDVMHDK